jgi:hypothetical protein
VHRRTVRQALADAVPPPRRTPQRPSPVLGSYREVIRGPVATSLAAPMRSAGRQIVDSLPVSRLLEILMTVWP